MTTTWAGPPGIEFPIPDRDERTREEERYRIYELRRCRGCGGSGRIDKFHPRDHSVTVTESCSLCDGGYELVCVAAVATLQGIGPCLATLADDDREAGLRSPPARGVKDDVERRWLCSLWNPKRRR